ncbi:MAG: hypothetical protein R2744_13325 [Bacteroidales bacterium]
MARNRFITVIGASGSGKSSLIYCGGYPLTSGEGKEKGPWKVLNMRPGNDPIGNLAARLAAGAGIVDAKEQAGVVELARNRDAGLDSLINVLNLGKGASALLLLGRPVRGACPVIGDQERWYTAG